MRRKPTALKQIDGTLRRDRANHREPKPAPAENLEPPIPLDDHARKFWDYHAPKLSKLNLLTELDVYTLGLASEWWSIHRRAMDGLDSDLVHTTESNGECCRPELTAAKQALTNLTMLMARFGMDPISRSKISVEDQIADLYFKRPVAAFAIDQLKQSMENSLAAVQAFADAANEGVGVKVLNREDVAREFEKVKAL